MSAVDRDSIALHNAIAAERRGAWIGAVIFELFAMVTVLPFSASAARRSISPSSEAARGCSARWARGSRSPARR